MNHEQARRPLGVALISTALGLMAAAQILAFSWLLAIGSSDRAVGAVVTSLSTFDWIALYCMAGLLLTSMVLFYRQRQRAIRWFSTYIGVGSALAFVLTFAPGRPPYFNEYISLGGLCIALLVLAYMFRLRRRHILA